MTGGRPTCSSMESRDIAQLLPHAISMLPSNPDHFCIHVNAVATDPCQGSSVIWPTTKGKYGELSLDETLAMLDATEPNDPQIELLIRGMETPVGYLGTW